MRALLIALLLAMLAVTGAAQESPTDRAVLLEAPFLEYPEPGRIVVDLAPEGGRSFPLLVDTGATFSVVTPRLARTLGVTVRRTKFDPYRRPTRLGRDLLFFVDDSLSDTAGAKGFEVALLGGNFLAEYVLELDMAKRRMRLLDPERYEVPEQTKEPGAVSLPLRIISNRPSLEVEVSGRTLLAMLDTGAQGGLMLDDEFADEARVSRRPDLPSRFFTFWGEVASVLGEAERLAVGPFVFSPMPVVVLPNGWFNFGLAKDATIGMDVLSQFLVRIDYPRERIWLQRRPDWKVAWQMEEWTSWPDPGDPGVQVVSQAGVSLTSVSAVSATVDVEPEDLQAARGPEPLRRRIWLDVAVPAEGKQQVGRIAWTEVRGWAGVDTPTRHDVMVVVDVSGSTAWASGMDVDGDGKLGKKRRQVDRWRTFNPRHYSSDPGDTVLAAELLATHGLIELLDPVRSRVGLVSFSDGATLLAPVGSDGPVLAEGLEILEENFGAGATNLSAALDLAIKALVASGGKGRQKSIVLLSDGYPTAPGTPETAATAARERAEEAIASGVRIYSFALGLEENAEDDVYQAIAVQTGGRYERLDAPGEIVDALPRINLTRVAGVEILNRTTGEAGKALRVFPDGSFDAFVPLAPGENILQVTARGEEGGAQVAERRVFFDAREPGSPEEALAFEDEAKRMEQALRLRAIELELAVEARGRGPEQERELEVRVDESRE